MEPTRRGTVNIASGYKLPTSSEGLLLTNEYTKTINHFGKITSVYNGLYNRGSFTSNTGSANTSSSCYIYKNSTSTQLAQYTSTGDKSLNINIASSDTTLQIWIVGNAADAFIIADISSLAGTYTLSFTYSKTSANVSTIANIMLNEGSTALSYSTYYGRIVHERDIEAELLWRNGNPSSYFDGKTVTTTDMSRYKYLVITYRQWVEWDVYQTIKLRMNNANGSFLISGHRFDSNEGVSRKCGRTSNTTIEFGNCYLNNSSTTQNGFIVPIEIYGTNTL